MRCRDKSDDDVRTEAFSFALTVVVIFDDLLSYFSSIDVIAVMVAGSTRKMECDFGDFGRNEREASHASGMG